MHLYVESMKCPYRQGHLKHAPPEEEDCFGLGDSAFWIGLLALVEALGTGDENAIAVNFLR